MSERIPTWVLEYQNAVNRDHLLTDEEIAAIDRTEVEYHERMDRIGIEYEKRFGGGGQ